MVLEDSSYFIIIIITIIINYYLQFIHEETKAHKKFSNLHTIPQQISK